MAGRQGALCGLSLWQAGLHGLPSPIAGSPVKSWEMSQEAACPLWPSSYGRQTGRQAALHGLSHGRQAGQAMGSKSGGSLPFMACHHGGQAGQAIGSKPGGSLPSVACPHGKE